MFLLILSLLVNFALLGGRSTGRLPESLDERYVAGSLTAPDKIAVVEIDGGIDDFSVPHMLKQLRQARVDKHVKAVVLRVESPGGTVTGSDQIWREVVLLKQSGKPLVVSMGGVAASGGYYVSAPADRIYAEPTTMTGSVGVIMELPNVSELMKKVGVDMISITAGEWKGMGSPFQPLTERDRDRFQSMINETYSRFLRVVAQGRKLTEEKTRSVAEGQVFTAAEALRNGLIDELGYMEDAIAEAKRRAGLVNVRVVRYNRPLGILDALIGVSAGGGSPILDEKTIMKLRTPRLMMILR